MTELGMTEGFDVGLEMSGAESAFNQMLDAMNHGGRIAVLGIPAGPMTLDINDVIFKGLRDPGDLRTPDLRDVVQDGRDAAERARRRAASSPIELPADRFEDAFAIVARRRVRQGHPRLAVSDLSASR